MADIPDLLVLERHRDLVGVRPYGLWMRWTFVGLLTAVAILALLNVFGQRPTTQTATSPTASITLYAPEHLRSGLLWSARFHIHASRGVEGRTPRARSGLGGGDVDQYVEPGPIGEASDDGRLSFDLGHIPRGKSYILFMQFQINPTNVAWRRPQNVELDDGGKRILLLHHRVTIYP